MPTSASTTSSSSLTPPRRFVPPAGGEGEQGNVQSLLQLSLLRGKHLSWNYLKKILGAGLLTTCLWLISRRRRSTALDNLPGPPAGSWLSGSLDLIADKNGWEYHREISEKYGSIIRIKGLFGRNGLYVYEPKAALTHSLQDQNIYEEAEGFIQINKLLFGEGLLATLGEQHRRHRKMLNPVFSIAHLREMVPIFYDVVRKLQDTLVKMTANGPKEVDMLDWNTRVALELIGQSGLGYTFDSLEENSIPHPYAVAAKKMVSGSSEIPAVVRKWLVPTIVQLIPRRLGRFLVDWVPSQTLHLLRDGVDLFHKTSVEIVEAKKKAIQEGDEALTTQVGRGKDVISILMKANMATSAEDKLSDEELLGQVTTLTFAATDTTSGALSRIIHLLATHKDYQAKVREEIRVARKANGGQDLGYDALSALPFLEAICRETLRLYPPVSTLMRVARADIMLPLGSPVKGINGEEIREIPVPKGTPIVISILSSNRDPKLWGPDAYEWKPERWLKPLPEAVVNARIAGVYSHLLTFFGGSRACM
ncbi:unnamed protein product [Cyclocybe aegerita]|uniref:Cytochrome P450 n=1 Tax=Cyclocybe aegerita TaxID=1973307 RepID=A0A8S0W017_CYCAE|nr:unnamed protein product [Cyclocybe aegerita]